MNKMFLAVFSLLTVTCSAQIVSLTPQASTIIISNNTTITPSGGPFKTYIVCPGATLSYAESSSMDTIILLGGSSLKIDSTFSYGYASIFAKAGSTVDMNFRQSGSLKYENGVTIIDTNTGPSSFFMGSQLVSMINVSYANLPGASACTPNSIKNDDYRGSNLSLHATENTLSIYSSTNESLDYFIMNIQGQVVYQSSIKNTVTILDISQWPTGMYFFKEKSNNTSSSIKFIK